MKQLLYIAVCLALMVGSATAQGLVFTETWNGFTQTTPSVDADHEWNKNGGCFQTPTDAYNSFSTIDDPCTPGDKVLRILNKIGDTVDRCGSTNWNEAAGNCSNGPCYPRKHRSEVIPVGNTTRPEYNTESWTGWRVYIPDDSEWPIDNRYSWISFQGICLPGGRGVDFDLRIHNNERWRTTIRRTTWEAEQAGTPRNDLVTDHGPVERGTWNNFVFRWVRRYSTGITQLWHNGVLILDYVGTNTKNQTDNCLIKHGLYYGTGVPISHGTATHKVLFDDFKMAYGSGHYETVDPDKAFGSCEVEEPPPAAFPTQPVLDTFTATENPISTSGLWSINIAGTGGDCESTGGILRDATGAGVNGECYITNPASVPQEAYVTLAGGASYANGSSTRLYGCLIDGIGTSSVDGYNIRVLANTSGTDSLHVERMANNVNTQLGADISQEHANGNKVGIAIDGSGGVDMYYNTGSGWVLTAERTDGSPYNCSNSRIGLRLPATQNTVDDFGGGPVIVSASHDLELRAQQVIIGE